jgi:hypothetical protein
LSIKYRILQVKKQETKIILKEFQVFLCVLGLFLPILMLFCGFLAKK